MVSDMTRASAAVIIAAGLGAGLSASAPALREAGFLPADVVAPAPTELVYTIINMTEDLDARAACPLDLAKAREHAEAGLTQANLKPVYSPIAGGPDVITHEVSTDQTCLWTATTYFAGTVTQPQSDLPDAAYSSLEQAGRNVRLVHEIGIR
jgi:hypothetical protein